MEPLYRQVQQNIKSQILSGIYSEGDLLPSENELQQLHSVNRSVIRQALDLLMKEGYIVKKQGKGSIVAKIQRRTLGLLSIKGFSQIQISGRIQNRERSPGVSFREQFSSTVKSG
jgi:GntR family transcriptional regulator/GntR family frlABCD operon transcriptional regulator